jgi:hypothetical protein
MPARLSLPVLLALVALLGGGCARITEADKEAAIEQVRAHLEAMKSRKPEAVAATVHPSSPHFEVTKAVIERVDLMLDLKSAEVESTKGDTIAVHFVLETRKLGGAVDIKDVREDGVFVLRRDGVTWKLWSKDVRQTTPLGN